jgi:hypothetical protein
MTSPQVGFKQILAAKRVVRRSMAKRAARKYTHVWDQVIKEAMGVVPKTNKIPPNFKGNQNEKFRRALLYKNRLVNYALKHPRSYYSPLYRGIRGWELNKYLKGEIINKNTLSSFSKRKNVAKSFAVKTKNTNKKVILVLKPNKRIPSINFTTGKFQSEHAPGGSKFTNGDLNEREVLLPPGRFTVKNARRNKGVIEVFVSFNARNYVPPKPKPLKFNFPKNL